MSWFKTLFMDIKGRVTRDELAFGQLRQITKEVAGIESGTKVIVKGYGEYDGWDVEIMFENGERTDIGGTQLLENSKPI